MGEDQSKQFSSNIPSALRGLRVKFVSTDRLEWGIVHSTEVSGLNLGEKELETDSCSNSNIF